MLRSLKFNFHPEEIIKPLFIATAYLTFAYIIGYCASQTNLFSRLPDFLLVNQDINRVEKMSSIVRNAFISLAGIGGAFGLWLALRRTKVNEQSHITDQFTKAVEQLGNESLAVRLGGIYALWRIAEDSPKRDYPRVLNILCEFIRNYNDITNYKPPAEPGTTDPFEDSPQKPEILVILELYTNRIRKLRNNRHALNLSNCDLSELHLGKVDFSYCDLTRTDLTNTFIENANFRRIDLSSANATDAAIIQTDFTKANLIGTKFISAYMNESNFTKARCLNTNFENSSLINTNFTKAYIERTNFSNTSLMSSKFKKARFYGSDFISADMGGIDFKNARFMETNITGADFSFFEGAVTNEITQEQLNQTWALADLRPTGLKDDLVVHDLREHDINDIEEDISP